MPGFPVLQYISEFAQSQVHLVGDSIQPSVVPVSFPQSLSASGSFSNESALHFSWPKYWRFSFSISLSNEYSGLIFLRLTGLTTLLSKGLSKSFLKHHSSKASILWHSAFFMVKIPHLFMTTRKSITLIVQMFEGKVMSLLFNMLYSFVIAFFPRSKHLLILWNSAYSWVYLFLSPLSFASLLSLAIFKGSSNGCFAFLHFFFLGMMSVTAPCTVLQTLIHSSSGTKSTKSHPLNLFVTCTV